MEYQQPVESSQKLSIVDLPNEILRLFQPSWHQDQDGDP